MSERRTRWLLVVLLLAQLFMLAAQLPGRGGGESLLEVTLLRATAPFGRLVARSAALVSSVVQDLALNRVLVDENRRLRAEVEELRREKVRLSGVEGELERLAAGVEYARAAGDPLLVADVVYIDHASWLQTLVVAVGSERVTVNQPVVSAEGLVGRVVVVAGPYAKVQLVSDHSASVGVMIERTRRQGVARGAGRGMLDLDFVPLQADVQVGDRVVTAGIDGVYPRGIPVGTVTSVAPGSELFHRIRVAPSVDFGRLDQVYILARRPLPEEVKEALPDAQR